VVGHPLHMNLFLAPSGALFFLLIRTLAGASGGELLADFQQDGTPPLDGGDDSPSVALSAACAEHASCLSCTSAPSLFGGSCHWCPLGERCHAVGSLFTHCSSDQFVNSSQCPPPSPPKTKFDKDVAYEMLKFSTAAYDDDPASQLDGGFEVKKIFHYTLGLWNEAFGFLGIDKAARRIVLAFRGTTTVTQLSREILQSGLVPMPGVPNATVVHFFLLAADSLNASFGDDMTALHHDCMDCSLWITGHSLGGAVAMLTAARIASLHPSIRPLVYTFGQPRVGNYFLARHVNALLPNALFRVVNAADIVPHVPACATTKVQQNNVSQTVCQQGAGYYHAGTELWFPAGDYANGVMCGFRECVHEPEGEDLSCSFGILSMGYSPSTADHHGYFAILDAGFCGSSPPAPVIV